MNQWMLGAALLAASVALPAQEMASLREPAVDVGTLPDSPGAVRSLTVPALSMEAATAAQQPGTVPAQMAPRYSRTIKAGQAAELWGPREKFIAAFRKQTSVAGLLSPVVTAGFQHVRDSRPHYGTDSGAFGARIGAAYARQSTQQFVNLGLMSSLLHEDPRYYVLGPTHSFKSRVLYAATRVLITRKDDGSNTANIPLFAGVVAGQALANGFYPDQDRRWSRTFTGSLGSLGSKMATQQFKEFGGEIRQHLPFRKKK